MLGKDRCTVWIIPHVVTSSPLHMVKAGQHWRSMMLVQNRTECNHISVMNRYVLLAPSWHSA